MAVRCYIYCKLLAHYILLLKLGPWDSFCVYAAIESHSVECLKYMNDNGFLLENACAYATRLNKLDVVHFLHNETVARCIHRG